MSDVENPLEPFKRATTATIRAIAGDDELDVVFGAGPPVVRGSTLRLPVPRSVQIKQKSMRCAGLAMNLLCAFAITMLSCMLVTAPRAVLRKKCLSG